MRFSILYQIVKQGVKVSRLAFYRKRSVIGLENLPKNKPYILAANHQNAFMDPIMIAGSIPFLQSFYLVRADIFKKKAASKALHALNMLPIYRMRDGVDSMDKNTAIFEKCYNILKRGNPVMIFPEGNHSNVKQLRPVKKGIARIAFGAEDANDFSLDLQIVPVGVNYSNHTNVGATLQVHFGTPIPISEYKETYLKEPSKVLSDVRERVHEGISKLIINIKPKHYSLLEDLRKIFENELSASTFDLNTEIRNSQKLIKDIEDSELTGDQEKQINTLIDDVKSQAQKMSLKLFSLSNEKYNSTKLLMQSIALLITLPIFIFGLINNYFPFYFPNWIVKKKIKDLHFHSSLKMGISLIFFPVYYFILFCIVWIISGHIIFASVYVFSAFVLGFGALNWFYIWRGVSQKMKVNRLFDTANYQSLIKSREELKKYISSFYTFPVDA